MFEKLTDVLNLLKKAQNVESDNRERAREAQHFVNKRDGQWEPDVISVMSKRPRYTFDKTGPIVDQIAGEIDQADFDIRIRPAGGDATKDVAKTYDGLVRNIESMSSAQHIYSQAGRRNVISGIAGWEIIQDYVDGDSFEQDLLISPLSNYDERVFFDPGAELQDQSDAGYAFILTSMSKDDYDERFPEGSGASVSIERNENVYYFKKEEVVVGKILYKKPVNKVLVLFTDGSVREDNEDLQKVMDELAEQGITEKARRTRKTAKVMSRLFDGKDWLVPEQETVFDLLPVVPVFGNFDISEGKIIYRGAVERMMDPQRVYNYTRSRETEEVALSPRGKYWGTEAQVAGHEDTLATLNTNNDPFQKYNVDPEAPNNPPVFQGGAQQNAGLLVASQNSSQDLTEAAGLFGLNQGNPGDSPLSGIAIQSLQNKGDNGTIKWFSPLEVAICYTAKVLVKAIPKVYDTERQLRILNEDGSEGMVSVNERVFDNETETWVTVNDLSKGQYDVTCDVGPAFKNRQQETVKALTEIVAADPNISPLSSDVMLKNINSPGVDLVAERVRENMVNNGLIPESQLTDDEKERIQQAQLQAEQQGQEPSPEDVIAQAEVGRVQAETADILSKAEDRQNKFELEIAKLKLRSVEQGDKQDLDELKLMLQQQAQNSAQQQQAIEANLKGQQAVFDVLNTQANTLKILRDAMGVDAIVGPGNTQAYAQQAEKIVEQQQELDES